jgi:hypothetical protein
VFKKDAYARRLYKFCKHIVKIFGHQHLLADLLEAEQLAEHDNIVLHLLNDCSTRWYSTYLMLQRIHRLWYRVRAVLASPPAMAAVKAKRRPILSELVALGDSLVGDLPFLLVILNVIRMASEKLEGKKGFASEAIFVQDNVEKKLKVMHLFLLKILRVRV